MKTAKTIDNATLFLFSNLNISTLLRPILGNYSRIF